MKIIPVRTVSGVAILRVALIAVAATSAACWIGIMLEYEVHPWLLVLTAGSVTGVVAGILQHRALAIAYVVGTVVALLDVFVASTSDGTLRFTLLGASTLAGIPIGLAAIKVFGRTIPHLRSRGRLGLAEAARSEPTATARPPENADAWIAERRRARVRT